MITGGNKGGVMSEINMTPFIDVVLILLIVFIIAAPVMFSQIDVSLPEAKSGSDVSGDVESKEPITITVTKDKKYYIGDDQITEEALITEVQKKTENDKGSKVIIRGDSSSSYESVIFVLDMLNSNGYNKISLLTNKKD